MNLVVGIIFILVGAMTNFQVPVPGLALNLSHTAAMIGMMLVLFPVVKQFYVQPLQEAIQDRNSRLESTFTEAEELKGQMAKMKTDYEARLVATEAQAREQIQAQIREAQQIRTQLMAEASVKADDMLRKAQQEIESERNRTLSELRLHVVDLTMLATEKLLGENIDSDRNRKLVEEYIDKVEVAN